MKALKITLAAVVVLIVVVLVTVSFFLGSVIKTGVEQAGPKVLGVPMSLARARVYPLAGRIRFDQLTIGNPAGFKTDHSFKIGSFVVEWVPRSVFTKRIHITTITIDAPDIGYEQTLSGNNFGAIMAHLKSAGPAEGAPPKAPAPPTEKAPPKERAAAGQPSGRKVIIDNFVISNGRVGVSLPGMGAAAVPIPLPTIHLTDIGKEEDGASIPDVMAQVMGAIAGSVTKAVASSGKLVGQGLDSAGKGVADGAQQAGAAAADIGKGAGDAAAKAASDVKGLLGIGK